MSSRWLLLLILVTCVSSTGLAGNDFKACPLLKATEIHDIMGITVGEGTEDVMGGMFQCSWAGEGPNDPSLTLSFEKAASNPKDSCESRWKGEKDLGRQMQDAAGIGDRAWWSKNPAQKIIALTTCGPKGVLRISIWGATDETAAKKQTEAIARKALSRL